MPESYDMSDLRKKKKTTIWQSFGRCRSWASWPMPTGSGSSREAEGRGDKSSSLAGLPRTKGRAKLGPNVVILQPHLYLWPSTCPFRWEAISGMLFGGQKQQDRGGGEYDVVVVVHAVLSTTQPTTGRPRHQRLLLTDQQPAFFHLSCRFHCLALPESLSTISDP